VAYLALADWCQEQPDAAIQARGEHVRLSLALAKLSATTRPVAKCATVSGRWRRRHRAAWLGPLLALAHRCDFLPGGLVKVEVTGGRSRSAREAKCRPPRAEEFAWFPA